jgi:hypothetical protein
LLAASTLRVQAAAISAAQIEQIELLSKAALTKDSLPGLSIAVAKGDQIWSAGFGRADLENDVAVDSSSLFRTGSQRPPRCAWWRPASSISTRRFSSTARSIRRSNGPLRRGSYLVI